MKKFLGILGTFTIIGSGVLTSVAVNSSSSEVNNEINNNLNKDNSKVLDENINSLKQIDKQLVLNSLVQKENDVVINYQFFLNKNLTNEFINLMKNFQLSNINVNDAKQLLFTKAKEEPSFNVYSMGDWKVSAHKPKAWYEWIVGVWRLEFNTDFVQDIVAGMATLSDLVGIISEAGIYAKVAIVASAILLIGSLILDHINKGNGILFRFIAWVIPTKVTNSTHIWK